MEGLFAYIKTQDFEKWEDPDPRVIQVPWVKRLTNKLALLANVSNCLFDISAAKITRFFRERLAFSQGFISLNKV
jgi:hypothetical protein